MNKSKSLKSILNKFNIKDFAIDNVYYLLGCMLYALGVNIFAIPNNIAQSGITGLAIIINYLVPQLPVGLTGLVLNIPLIILAWIFIGKAFTLKTLWTTVILSICIDGVASVMDAGMIGAYTGDKLLAIFSVSLSVIVYLIFLKIFSSIDNEEIAWAKNITVRKIKNH